MCKSIQIVAILVLSWRPPLVKVWHGGHFKDNHLISNTYMEIGAFYEGLYRWHVIAVYDRNITLWIVLLYL